MRFLLFLCGLSIIALGIAATRALEYPASTGFLNGALQLGGGLVICGFFSIRWYIYGVAAGGALSLLGFSAGLANLPKLLKVFRGELEIQQPALETAVTLVSLLLLVAVVKTLFAERQRRLLEAMEKEDDNTDVE